MLYIIYIIHPLSSGHYRDIITVETTGPHYLPCWAQHSVLYDDPESNNNKTLSISDIITITVCII